MLFEGIFKGFHVVVYFLGKFIQVALLRLLGFHQSMSLIRNQGQLLFELEYPIHYLVLPINCLSFLYYRERLKFFWNFLPDAGLNRAKLQSVKCFSIFLGEADERFGPCYLNAAFIFNKDSFFREHINGSALLESSCKTVEVWIQSDQLEQLSTDHEGLELLVVNLGTLLVDLLQLVMFHRDQFDLTHELRIRIHHGLFDVPDEGLQSLEPLGTLSMGNFERLIEVMPLLSLRLQLFDYN